VDPKLFQAKVRTPTPELVKLEVHPVSTPIVAPAATPAKGKKRARTASQKEKEKEKEDKKKISHARKVSS
jgi:ribosomal protein L12E/L44/L45/RPP1/RPP2